MYMYCMCECAQLNYQLDNLVQTFGELCMFYLKHVLTKSRLFDMG